MAAVRYRTKELLTYKELDVVTKAKPKKLKLPKILRLYVKSWRCGASDDNRDNHKEAMLGSGDTYLRNRKGFMCCVGQMAIQSGVSPKACIDVTKPANFAGGIEVEGLGPKFCNAAIEINDNDDTPVDTKISRLRSLVAKTGRKLVVIRDRKMLVRKK